MIKKLSSVMLMSLMLAPPAGAEEARKLSPVVVSATKVATPQEQLGASVTVVTDEDLRLYNQTQLGEALRSVPGVEIQRSGGPGHETNIRIRGAGPAQVQVLVDGMRMKSPTLGTADLATLPLDTVDRIEIIRGPQSSLYGADAIGGVVNIITKKGQGPPRGTLAVEGGSFETFRETAGFQAGLGRFNVNLSASRWDHSGQFDNDDSDQTAVGGRIGYDFPWKGELSLSGRYSKTNIDLPVHSAGPPTIRDPNSQTQIEQWFYNLAYAQPIFRWWSTSARYGQWWNNNGFQDAPPPSSDTVRSTQIDTRRREFELVNTFPLTSWTTLTIGGEHRNERGRNRGSFREEINTLGGFVQDELRFLDRLFVSGSVRWEDNDTFGEAVTPRVSAAFLVPPTGTKLRGSWGKGFRAPTINDLFFPGFANPNLQPEHSESYEVGFDEKLAQNRVRFGATYFHNEFLDLIQFVTAGGVTRPENVGRARTQGVEVTGEWEPLDWLLAYGNYTHTSTLDKATHLELRRFARHRWNTGVAVTPIERLSVFAEAHVVSSQSESANLRNPGYHRIDLGGTYRLAGRVGAMERLDFTLRIENLSDEKYSEIFGFRALGFNAMAGLRVIFQ